MAVEPPGRGQPLDERRARSGVRSMRGDTEPGTCTSVKSVRVRIQLADRLEHLLAAAHAGQPVVDERNSARLRTRRRTRRGRHPRQHLVVDLAHPARPSAPRRTRRARARPRCAQVVAQRLVDQHAAHRVGDRLGLVRIDQQRRVADDFRQRRDVRGDRPACRWPSPRAAAARSLRRATGTRRRAASR